MVPLTQNGTPFNQSWPCIMVPKLVPLPKVSLHTKPNSLFVDMLNFNFAKSGRRDVCERCVSRSQFAEAVGLFGCSTNARRTSATKAKHNVKRNRDLVCNILTICCLHIPKMSAEAQSEEKRYALHFGLAREPVPITPNQTKQLTQEMKDALFDMLASVWGVSVETYKSQIASNNKAWGINTRFEPSTANDLEMVQGVLPTSTHNILKFLNTHKFSTNCKKARPVEDLLLSDKEALENFLRRMWDASGYCLVLNQLFESDSKKGLRASMPEAFFYCLRNFMKEREDDDAACCQFAEQLFLVMHILVKDFLQALTSLLCELDPQQFSDEVQEAYSVEIPEYIWNYAQPADDSDYNMKTPTLGNLEMLRMKKQSELNPSSEGDDENDTNQQLLRLLLQGLRQSSNDNTDKLGDASPVDPN